MSRGVIESLVASQDCKVRDVLAWWAASTACLRFAAANMTSRIRCESRLMQCSISTVDVYLQWHTNIIHTSAKFRYFFAALLKSRPGRAVGIQVGPVSRVLIMCDRAENEKQDIAAMPTHFLQSIDNCHSSSKSQ